MFETLIVPLDGSDFAAKALPAAVAIARMGHAGLRLVGIAHDDDELARVQRHLNGTARQVAATKGPEIDVIVDPDPTGALLELAADCTSVLCFASHDHGTVAARLIHSVGSALVARAPCPIVVVGEHAAEAARATDVVVAVDGVGDPQPLLATAMSSGAPAEGATQDRHRVRTCARGPRPARALHASSRTAGGPRRLPRRHRARHRWARPGVGVDRLDPGPGRRHRRDRGSPCEPACGASRRGRWTAYGPSRRHGARAPPHRVGAAGRRQPTRPMTLWRDVTARPAGQPRLA